MADIDSLPYYDKDIDTVAGLRERLEQEIQAELQAVPVESIDLSDRIPPPVPSTSASAFLNTELDRVENKKAVPKGQGLDATRYSLPAPTKGLKASADDWTKAVKNASAQVEHQSLRIANLELLNKYGANSWRVSNFLVEKEIERLDRQKEDVNNAIEEINRERKARQLEAGDQLASLEARWNTLVSGNLQLELANMTTEMEVDGLREREEELRTQLEELQKGSQA